METREDDCVTFEEDPFSKIQSLKPKLHEHKFSQPTSANRSMIASKAIFEEGKTDLIEGKTKKKSAKSKRGVTPAILHGPILSPSFSQITVNNSV